MIAKANEFKVQKAAGNCTFHLNRRNDLEIFESNYFDFILSIIVLQHMEPPIILRYLKELIRVLKKGGLMVFQLPDAMEARAPYEEFDDSTEPVMEMHGLPKESVVKYLQENHGQVLDVYEDKTCGDYVKSYRYFVTK